jgi:hypothetical protein
MFYTRFRGLVAVGVLAVLGLILIWKGVTGDVMTTRLGDTLIPRWMYIVGGVALLAFPAMFILVRSETGRALLGF